MRLLTMSGRLLAASRGVLVGACAGVALALNDFGAIWLWLDMGPDRVALLNRLSGLLIPTGALVGGVGSIVLDGVRQALARALPTKPGGWSIAHAATVIASPLCVWIAWLLFTGGSASRLPLLWLLKPVAACSLVAAAWWSSTRIATLVTRVHRERSALPVAVGFIALAQVLIKLNQWLLPNLYDYLHGVLTALAFLTIALGIGLGVAQVPRIMAPTARWPQASVALAVALGAWFVSSIAALPANQNVAVSLLDPRAAHARSLMLAIGPLLQPAQTHRRTPTRTASPARLTARSDAHKTSDAHILLITIDALRADHLGSYGYQRPTSPNLDRLAAASWVFERAYTQAPHSSYSLCSLMTSEYLHETLELGARPPDATLATTLAAAGYHTAAFYTLGIFHTAAERLGVYEHNAFGFALHDHQVDQPEALTDRVLREIDRAIAMGEPNTLLWAHYFNVHEPYRATTFGTSDMDRYDSEIVRADAAIERLIREARRRFTHDVVVVITADHGEEFREHGGVYHGSTLYEEQVRVPLIINAPGAPPKRIRAPVEVIDIAPTLLGLVNVARPTSMRGDDLRRLLTDESAAPPVFSAVIHKRMVVKWPYKLIADLRFGLYELYRLDSDPDERRNLAGSEPALLASLRDEVYGWLDTLAVSGTAHDDPRMIAIEQGRLGDRRAVPTLVNLIEDDSAPIHARAEACTILGILADPNATTGLLRALRTKAPTVAAEAAIALGRMHNGGGRDVLRTLVLSEDPDLRSRAAVSLGRLRDGVAVPALIDSLWVAPNDYEREEAIRWLGRLRDGRALEPLISLLPEGRTRHLVVVALGAIGDPRAFDTLRDVLRWETHANTRDNVVRAFGMLKDPRAIHIVLPLAAADPTLKHASESLIRLGALETGAIGGSDMLAANTMEGFHRCTAFSEQHDWDYLHRTVCETSRTRAALDLHVPASMVKSGRGATLVLGLRRADSQDPGAVGIELGDHRVATATADAAWAEHRWPVEAHDIVAGHVRATLTATPATARFVIDHALLLPR